MKIHIVYWSKDWGKAFSLSNRCGYAWAASRGFGIWHATCWGNSMYSIPWSLMNEVCSQRGP
jgi:hypothetical protein